jgi:hypothetical protein
MREERGESEESLELHVLSLQLTKPPLAAPMTTEQRFLHRDLHREPRRFG